MIIMIIHLRWGHVHAGRHVFSIVTGIALTYYPFGNGIFNLFLPIITTYAIMLQIREYAGTLSWVVNFSYLVFW